MLRAIARFVFGQMVPNALTQHLHLWRVVIVDKGTMSIVTGVLMKHILPFVIAALFSGQAMAEDAIAVTENIVFSQTSETDLNQFIWKKRPIVVFANSDADPRYTEQIELLLAKLHDLEERDVVVLTDTDPSAKSQLRLKLRPRGFMLAIIGKDGGVKLRKPFPWDVREITRSIDKMPLRKRELREKKREASEG
jgi:hypothetical protein